MKTTRRLTQKKIRELMGVSADLAKLNYDRYRSFELPMTDDNAHVAAWTFAGDVYRGLDARSLSAASIVSTGAMRVPGFASSPASESMNTPVVSSMGRSPAKPSLSNSS